MADQLNAGGAPLTAQDKADFIEGLGLGGVVTVDPVTGAAGLNPDVLEGLSGGATPGEILEAVTQAETARDAAFVNANVYASTAAGLAAVADGVQFQVVAADGLSIQRYRRDSASVATAVGVPYPSASRVDFVQSDAIAAAGIGMRAILDEATTPAISRGDFSRGGLVGNPLMYGWRSPFKSNGKGFNAVQLTVCASSAGVMRVAVLSEAKVLLAWGDVNVGAVSATKVVALNSLVTIPSGSIGYISFFDPSYSRPASYPYGGAYDVSDADPSVYREQYVTTSGVWVNVSPAGNYRVTFRAFDLLSKTRSIGSELTLTSATANRADNFREFAAQDRTVVSSSASVVAIAATSPSAALQNIAFFAWGCTYNPAGVSFNAVRIPLIAQTQTTEASKWKELHVFVRVGSSPLSSGVVVARGSVRINSTNANQSNVTIVLTDPATGAAKTLTDADLGSKYFIAVHAKNSVGGRAACGRPYGTMSNAAGEFGYMQTSNASSVEDGAFGLTGSLSLAFEHLLLTDPVLGTAYDFTPNYAQAISLVEIPPEIVVPPYLYGVQGRECNVYFDNLTPAAQGIRYSWDVASPSNVGAHQSERFTWIPSGALSSGALSVSVISPRTGVVLGSKSAMLRSASSSAGSGANKKIITIGDSLIGAGIITQTLVDIATADVMGLTLLGSRGTGANKHEGRGGWTISTYTSDYSDVTYGANPFWVGGGVNFPGYLSANSIDIPDWVAIHLGINDCFGLTSDQSVVDKAGTEFTKLDVLIASIKASGAGTKVALMIAPPPASQDAFGVNYTTVQTRDRFKRNILIWARELIARYSGQEASRIYIVPTNVALDTVNNVSYAASAPVNSRSTVLVSRANNGVHPATSGYQQMGDALWAFLKCQA